MADIVRAHEIQRRDFFVFFSIFSQRLCEVSTLLGCRLKTLRLKADSSLNINPTEVS